MTPCLCAPTSHPGSFRCRFHRAAAITLTLSSTPAKYPAATSPAARVITLCTAAEGAGCSRTPARHVSNTLSKCSSTTAPSVVYPDPSPSRSAYPAYSRSSSGPPSSASYTGRVLKTSPLPSRCASTISAHAVAMAILKQHSHESSKQNSGHWNQRSSGNTMSRSCTSWTQKIGPSRLSRMAAA